MSECEWVVSGRLRCRSACFSSHLRQTVAQRTCLSVSALIHSIRLSVIFTTTGDIVTRPPPLQLLQLCLLSVCLLLLLLVRLRPRR